MERWTANEAREVVAEWMGSGQSAPAYGRDHGIDPQRLYFWKRRLGADAGRRAKKTPKHGIARLVPAVVRVGKATDSEHVVVRLPNGVSIEASAASVSPEWLAALVSELSGR